MWEIPPESIVWVEEEPGSSASKPTIAGALLRFLPARERGVRAAVPLNVHEQQVGYLAYTSAVVAGIEADRAVALYRAGRVHDEGKGLNAMQSLFVNQRGEAGIEFSSPFA